MATFIGTPPLWIFGTADAGTTVQSSNWIRISRIRWVAGSGSAAGNECKLTDQNGNIIFDEFASGADYETFDMTFESGKGKNFNGLIVTTLAAGNVYVYLS